MEPAAARVGRVFCKLRDPGLRFVYAGGISLGINLALPVCQPQIKRRIIFQRKRFRQDIYERRERPAADGGAAAFVVDVQDALGDADNGKFPPGKAVQCVRVVLSGQDDRFAEILFGIQQTVGQTFVRRLRQSAAFEPRKVDLRGQGQKPARLCRTVCDGCERVRALFTLAGFHARVGGESFCVRLVKADGADEPEVVHPVRLGIVVQRMYHCRLCQPQAAEEAHAQRDDRRNRQKPAETAADLAQCQLQHTRHHSMLSTGTGASQHRTSVICPLLTRMTRSAMAVRAELCVIMTTVMPFSRLCCCRSARICLPV